MVWAGPGSIKHTRVGRWRADLWRSQSDFGDKWETSSSKRTWWTCQSIHKSVWDWQGQAENDTSNGPLKTGDPTSEKSGR